MKSDSRGGTATTRRGGGFSSHFMQGFMPKDNYFCGLLQLFCSFILLITM